MKERKRNQNNQPNKKHLPSPKPNKWNPTKNPERYRPHKYYKKVTKLQAFWLSGRQPYGADSALLTLCCCSDQACELYIQQPIYCNCCFAIEREWSPKPRQGVVGHSSKFKLVWTSPKACKHTKVSIHLYNCKLRILHVGEWLAERNIKQKVY